LNLEDLSRIERKTYDLIKKERRDSDSELARQKDDRGDCQPEKYGFGGNLQEIY